MITTYDAALAALEAAMSDATGDNPDVGADDIAHDMVAAVTWECTPEVAAELCRTQIGWWPAGADPRCKSLVGEPGW